MEWSEYRPEVGDSVVGVGVDVVDIARFSAALDRTPALRDRLFTEAERDLPRASLAARFAAKEALGKALGTPGDFSWQDVHIASTSARRPYFVIRGQVRRCAEQLGVRRLHLSLTHDAGIASAMVVAERERT
ncbi:holo-ACP synthase [Devriesea agamarum]|uniref:holo-ACP synthase n=1 Tax=Devriesea agamarum TaxID=472569 RepID=UPI00071CD9D2|nr:holo-ACP synthase [Devriesea agamarum]